MTKTHWKKIKTDFDIPVWEHKLYDKTIIVEPNFLHRGEFDLTLTNLELEKSRHISRHKNIRSAIFAARKYMKTH